MEDRRVVVIGAGPAGLTTAYQLTKFNLQPIVIEKQHRVGGLARTENYKGFYFDMGGHRFFTKVKVVQDMWREILDEDFLRRQRLSRIYYNRKFFYYPLRPLNALHGLGLQQSLAIMGSYVRWQLFPYPREDTFEEWVTNRFGKRLFETFFKTYTEKVWGISCSELRAEWAAQRIKDLSLRTALLSMFVKPKRTIKTLIDQFDYPRLGPGMMWHAVAEEIERRGGAVRLNADVVEIHRKGNRIDSLTIVSGRDEEVIGGTHFISTMPVSELVQKLRPLAPAEIFRAAEKLTYRDFLTVCLIVNQRELFPDNWIYVHDPGVRVGRIQNFKNWSPDMVPDPEKTSLGLEYFCNQGDNLWGSPDDELIEMAKREVARIGLAKYRDIEDGCVVRIPHAYPVYDSSYREQVSAIRQYVDGLENFQTVGRNGLHRYNNQDHAMLTGILAVRNFILGEKNDLWSVNTDQEYHEEEIIEPGVAKDEALEVLQGAVADAFLKLDRLAFGLSVGAVSGVILFVATLWLVLKGGEVVGPRLQLLSHYFPGYTVTAGGSLMGLGYGFMSGFIGGWMFALLRNLAFFLQMLIIYRRAERRILRKIFDYL